MTVTSEGRGVPINKSPIGVPFSKYRRVARFTSAKQ